MMAGDPAIMVRPSPPVHIALPAMVWAPCGRCWGGKRIWHPGPFGLMPLDCMDCDGLGLRLVPA